MPPDCCKQALALRTRREYYANFHQLRVTGVTENCVPIISEHARTITLKNPSEGQWGMEGIDENGRQERLPWTSDYFFSSI